MPGEYDENADEGIQGALVSLANTVAKKREEGAIEGDQTLASSTKGHPDAAPLSDRQGATVDAVAAATASEVKPEVPHYPTMRGVGMEGAPSVRIPPAPVPQIDEPPISQAPDTSGTFTSPGRVSALEARAEAGIFKPIPPTVPPLPGPISRPLSAPVSSQAPDAHVKLSEELSDEALDAIAAEAQYNASAPTSDPDAESDFPSEPTSGRISRPPSSSFLDVSDEDLDGILIPDPDPEQASAPLSGPALSGRISRPPVSAPASRPLSRPPASAPPALIPDEPVSAPISGGLRPHPRSSLASDPSLRGDALGGLEQAKNDTTSPKKQPDPAPASQRQSTSAPERAPSSTHLPTLAELASIAMNHPRAASAPVNPFADTLPVPPSNLNTPAALAATVPVSPKAPRPSIDIPPDPSRTAPTKVSRRPEPPTPPSKPKRKSLGYWVVGGLIAVAAAAGLYKVATTSTVSDDQSSELAPQDPNQAPSASETPIAPTTAPAPSMTPVEPTAEVPPPVAPEEPMSPKAPEVTSFLSPEDIATMPNCELKTIFQTGEMTIHKDSKGIGAQFVGAVRQYINIMAAQHKIAPSEADLLMANANEIAASINDHAALYYVDTYGEVVGKGDQLPPEARYAEKLMGGNPKNIPVDTIKARITNKAGEGFISALNHLQRKNSDGTLTNTDYLSVNAGDVVVLPELKKLNVLKAITRDIVSIAQASERAKGINLPNPSTGGAPGDKEGKLTNENGSKHAQNNSGLEQNRMAANDGPDIKIGEAYVDLADLIEDHDELSYSTNTIGSRDTQSKSPEIKKPVKPPMTPDMLRRNAGFKISQLLAKQQAEKAAAAKIVELDNKHLIDDDEGREVTFEEIEAGWNALS